MSELFSFGDTGWGDELLAAETQRRQQKQQQQAAKKKCKPNDDRKECRQGLPS